MPHHTEKRSLHSWCFNNTDHNWLSTTVQGSFHQTGISVFQFQTLINPGTCREPLILEPTSDNHGDQSLPENYTTVKSVVCKTHSLSFPKMKIREIVLNKKTSVNEDKWINQGIQLLHEKNLGKDDFISWGTFHASQQCDSFPPALNVLLPLFHEKEATISMIIHGIHVLKQITSYLNPGQLPIIALDQPLFALVRYVQW